MSFCVVVCVVSREETPRTESKGLPPVHPGVLLNSASCPKKLVLLRQSSIVVNSCERGVNGHNA